MFEQLFGRYLVKVGAIEEGELEGLIEKLKDTRAKLGVIAVAEGYLTEEQAEKINKLQVQRDQRFGEIAVSENMLTEQQLDEILKKQGSPYIKFIQILVENTSIKLSKIDQYLDEFKKEQGFDDKEMNALKNGETDTIVEVLAFASKNYVTDIAALALRNITRFVTTDFYIEKIKSVKSYEYMSFAGQSMEGDHSILIGFGASSDKDGFLEIASNFTSTVMNAVTADAYDAVGEFSNCINGLLATELSQKGVKEEILPQTAFENQTATGDAYILPIYIKGHRVDLFIAVDSDVKIGTAPIMRTNTVKEGSIDTGDSKGTVVIVDDSMMSRKMLRNIIEKEGYTVVSEASDGLEGVLAYKQFMPDLVTMDITMPNMDGIEALKEIMDYDDDANVIMITAAGQQGKVIEALKLGAKKFITKPFDVNEILKSLEEVIE